MNKCHNETEVRVGGHTYIHTYIPSNRMCHFRFLVCDIDELVAKLIIKHNTLAA